MNRQLAFPCWGDVVLRPWAISDVSYAAVKRIIREALL
jgi:hypothetical protein